MMTLKDVVIASVAAHGLDPALIDWKRSAPNHPTDPTQITVWMTGDPEPLIIDIERPTH